MVKDLATLWFVFNVMSAICHVKVRVSCLTAIIPGCLISEL